MVTNQSEGDVPRGQATEDTGEMPSVRGAKGLTCGGGPDRDRPSRRRRDGTSLDPTVAVPVDEGNALGVDGAPPVREDEDDFATQSNWDVALVLQKVLAVVLAEVRRHLLGARHHRIAAHVLLALLEEAEQVVGPATDGDDGGEGVLGQLLGELADGPRVIGTDQHIEQVVAELFLQVRH